MMLIMKGINLIPVARSQYLLFAATKTSVLQALLCLVGSRKYLSHSCNLSENTRPPPHFFPYTAASQWFHCPEQFLIYRLQCWYKNSVGWHPPARKAAPSTLPQHNNGGGYGKTEDQHKNQFLRFRNVPAFQQMQSPNRVPAGTW